MTLRLMNAKVSLDPSEEYYECEFKRYRYPKDANRRKKQSHLLSIERNKREKKNYVSPRRSPQRLIPHESTRLPPTRKIGHAASRCSSPINHGRPYTVSRCNSPKLNPTGPTTTMTGAAANVSYGNPEFHTTADSFFNASNRSFNQMSSHFATSSRDFFNEKRYFECGESNRRSGLLEPTRGVEATTPAPQMTHLPWAEQTRSDAIWSVAKHKPSSNPTMAQIPALTIAHPSFAYALELGVPASWFGQSGQKTRPTILQPWDRGKAGVFRPLTASELEDIKKTPGIGDYNFSDSWIPQKKCTRRVLPKTTFLTTNMGYNPTQGGAGSTHDRSSDVGAHGSETDCGCDGETAEQRRKATSESHRVTRKGETYIPARKSKN